MNTNTQPSPPHLRIWQSWRGFGGWNYYFLLKFILLWQGYLNFNALNNLIFAAFLLFPLRSLSTHRLRHWIALPIGLALFYSDTWLPSIRSIIGQGGDLSTFSSEYILELINRFINWQWIGIAFALLVGYLFLSQWMRLTTLTIAVLLWVNLSALWEPQGTLKLNKTNQSTQEQSQTSSITNTASTAQNSGTTAIETASSNAVNGPPTNENLNAYLEQFYQTERNRSTQFPQQLPDDAQPFELLVINICSLSQADLDTVNLASSPLWSRFDLLFSNFNSATSYSGPASIRLLRASCGQASHKDLYQSDSKQCYLFDNLTRLGFTPQLSMDHSGVFGNYLSDLRTYANMQAPLMSQAGLSHDMSSFDGEPIFNDANLFDRWLENQQKAGTERTATFFNLIPLHDGNRFVGSNKPADYGKRAQTLLNQLSSFMDQLDKSGRKVMLVIIPEHGAALSGDKMQLSGLRDIPSPGITHIPVGVKFFGMQAPRPSSTLKLDSPSSYLAISELVARSVDGKIFTEPKLDWGTFSANLPQTPLVSENENSVVMRYQDKVYIRLNGGSWVPYPQ